MANYKMVALDLDGTTLTDDKRITENSRYWINKAVDAGVTVIFSTGRGIQTAGEIWKDIGLDGPMVMVNGAEIWKGTGEILERTFIDGEYIRKLYELAVSKGADFWGYSIESLSNQNNWTEEMFDRRWMKFGIRCDDLNIIDSLRQEVISWGNLEVTRSALVNMEISSRGITKEYGVRKVCDYLGIAMEDVMAIGDDLNDLKLIKAVGLGIAMENGNSILKEAADKITVTNENDGVAKAIQENLFG